MGRRRLVEGAGFRVGWDPDGGEFVGLVGTLEWAVELTGDEWADFRRLARQLAEAMAAMTIELMEEEAVAIELETEGLWMEVEGFPQRYGLRFMTQGGRGIEGAWPAEAVPGLLGAIAQMEADAVKEEL